MSNSVTPDEEVYSQSAIFTGFLIPSPPYLYGRDSILRSISVTFRPHIAGISDSLIVFSTGWNISLVS